MHSAVALLVAVALFCCLGGGGIVVAAPKTVCGTPFTDVPSKVHLADIVFQGTVAKLTPSKMREPNLTVSTQDAIFHVSEVWKGKEMMVKKDKTMPKTITVGVFRKDSRAGQCVGSVTVNKSYIVYVTLQKKGRNYYYRISAFPDVDSKLVRQQVRNSVCDNCLREPDIDKISSNVTATVGRRMKLECEVVGHPVPIITWFHDEQPLNRTERVNIRQTRKGSRVNVKNMSPEDAGTYRCEARNVLGTAYSDIAVSVRPVISNPPSVNNTAPDTNSSMECFGHYCLCKEQTFCLNGGICYQMLSINKYFCRCANDYIGNRCQEQISAGFDLARLAKTDVRWQQSDAESHSAKLPQEFLRLLEEKSRVTIHN